MKEIIFFVQTGIQSTLINKMFKSADLANGAIIRNGSGFEVSVQWKTGEIVDAARIEQTKQNLKNAFEAQGYCVLDISRKES